MALIPLRSDISLKLVHLMKGAIDAEERKRRGDTGTAFDTLRAILSDGKLMGGTGHIKGMHQCVCFSEAPISALAHLLAMPHASDFRYLPFGVMVTKQWLHQRGGRPVIYQPDTDYDQLPDSLKHLHVRHEPPNIDFTWEREWRVKAVELPFTGQEITVILPRREWAEALILEHTDKVKEEIALAERPGHGMAQKVTPYPWHMITLDDLGFDVPDELASPDDARLALARERRVNT